MSLYECTKQTFKKNELKKFSTDAVILAEPNSLICFAGPRVIEQTILAEMTRQKTVNDFIMDIVCHKSRKTFIETIINVANILLH